MEKLSMENKLYVGNLAYSTTEAELRRLFAKSGKVIAVDLIKDQVTGRPKGFAFVTMATPSEAQSAIGLLHNSTLANRKLAVNLARQRESQAGYQSRFSALGTSAPVQTVTGRNREPAQGGYQSRYSAFGAHNHNPAQPRRRGGGRRSNHNQ
jgi:RNA recognition motif-containing protein